MKPRHCERSEAIQRIHIFRARGEAGLPRRLRSSQ